MQLVALDREAISRHRQAIRDVYATAFEVTPREGERFLANALDRHVAYEAYRGLLAIEDGAVAGFTYGYRTQPGTWWNLTVAPAMAAAGVADWLSDAFEFVELAVRPEMQGRGIGAALHDTLLADAPGTRALLTTTAGDTPAMRLYLKRGWRVLVPDFHYPHVDEAAVIMGLDFRVR